MSAGSRRGAAFLLYACVSTVSGCSVLSAVDQSEKILDLVRPVAGVLEVEGDSRGPLVTLVHSPANTEFQLAGYRVYREPGPFVQILPEGEFQISVFEDANANLTLDPGERSATWPITLSGAGVVEGNPPIEGLVVSISESSTSAIPGGLCAIDAAKSHPALGTLASLDEGSFSSEAVSDGAWRPLDALQSTDYGLFSLGVPDPARVPVVFVHGAFASPDRLRALVESVDEERYQCWIFYYPTALHLKLTAWSLSTMLDEAMVRFELAPFVVVGHSMGGCISRAMLGWQLEGERTPCVERLITIATPFGGQSSAAFGSEWISEDVGYWRDLTPESDFYRWLYATELPANLPHYMIIASGDIHAAPKDQATDGTVTVASQTEPAIQRMARGVYVVAAGHNEVLRTEEGLWAFEHFLELHRAGN